VLPEHPETACYTAQVLEMPGLIYGGRTPEAALSECRAELADTIVWFAEEGWALPEPGSRPPDRDPDALAEPLVKIPAQVKSAAAVLGRKGGYVKSAVKAASSRNNLLKARAMGKVGGRPKRTVSAAIHGDALAGASSPKGSKRPKKPLVAA